MNVKQICDTIKNAIEQNSRKAVATIPAIVLLCSLAKRPGLSTIMSVINVIQVLKMKGIYTGPNPDGSPNLLLQVIYAVIDEIYRALRHDAYGQTATAPGAFQITATGANAGGTVQVVGTNITPYNSPTLIR